MKDTHRGAKSIKCILNACWVKAWYSQPSVLIGSTSWDSFGKKLKKISRKFHKAKLEFAVHRQLFT